MKIVNLETVRTPENAINVLSSNNTNGTTRVEIPCTPMHGPYKYKTQKISATSLQQIWPPHSETILAKQNLDLLS